MVLNVHWNRKAYYRLIINFLFKCCFTSTETVSLTATGAQDGCLDFHTAPELSDNFYDDVGHNVLRCQADRIIIIFEIYIYMYMCVCGGSPLLVRYGAVEITGFLLIIIIIIINR